VCPREAILARGNSRGVLARGYSRGVLARGYSRDTPHVTWCESTHCPQKKAHARAENSSAPHTKYMVRTACFRRFEPYILHAERTRIERVRASSLAGRAGINHRHRKEVARARAILIRPACNLYGSNRLLPAVLTT
jgi:hypothetical protein